MADGFHNSKRDKSLIKRSVFVSRVQKSYESAANKQKPQSERRRRRRPDKKLVATLDSLGSALADIEAEVAAEAAEGMDAERERLGRTRHRSLRTRPGALKRKEKMVREEMERFATNMALVTAIPRDDTEAGRSGGAAQESSRLEGRKGKRAARQGLEAEATLDKMNVDGGGDQQHKQPQSALSSRFAALRNYISSTMEQHPAFLKR